MKLSIKTQSEFILTSAALNWKSSENLRKLLRERRLQNNVSSLLILFQEKFLPSGYVMQRNINYNCCREEVNLYCT